MKKLTFLLIILAAFTFNSTAFAQPGKKAKGKAKADKEIKDQRDDHQKNDKVHKSKDEYYGKNAKHKDNEHKKSDREHQKVAICHKGKTIYVAEPAVKAHLAHGDYVGGCGEVQPQSRQRIPAPTPAPAPRDERKDTRIPRTPQPETGETPRGPLPEGTTTRDGGREGTKRTPESTGRETPSTNAPESTSEKDEKMNRTGTKTPSKESTTRKGTKMEQTTREIKSETENTISKYFNYWKNLSLLD